MWTQALAREVLSEVNRSECNHGQETDTYEKAHIGNLSDASLSTSTSSFFSDAAPQGHVLARFGEL